MRSIFLSLGILLAATFASAAACPDWKQSGETHHLSGSDLYSERTFTVTAGGNTNIQGCGNVAPGTDKGAGFVMARPDFTFYLSDLSKYRLVALVKSECDSILLINTATASWYYDDDDGGNLDARIDLSSPADGALDIWVGTHDGEYCNAVLSLETFRR